MKQLLIRADDLGYSDGVNYGIAKAVNKGVVKSVGVMTNMPTAMEIEAQYKKFIELTGKRPEYFEGHAVASDNFFKGLKIVAERYNLPYLEMPKETSDYVMFRNTKIYCYIPKDFAEYEKNPFTAVQDAVLNLHEDGCDMLVFHPGYIDDYLLKNSSMTMIRAVETEMLSNSKVKNWLEQQDLRLVTYSDLK